MDDANLIETGKIIQERRIAAGFTQKSLAIALHITDKAISKWERGICLPDVKLLPKLSLLLDVDVDMLISKNLEHQKWVGLIDFSGVDLSQLVYDKPLVYFMLNHYLLLGVTTIHVLSDARNREYLLSAGFDAYGFNFVFERPYGHKMMILNRPCFLFGSDLTQQFQGAMLSERNIRLVPENQEPVFYFSNGGDEYFLNRKKFVRSAAKRTLGRGMVCISADSQENILDIANFVRTYQKHSGLMIASLDEIVERLKSKP